MLAPAPKAGARQHSFLQAAQSLLTPLRIRFTRRTALMEEPVPSPFLKLLLKEDESFSVLPEWARGQAPFDQLRRLAGRSKLFVYRYWCCSAVSVNVIIIRALRAIKWEYFEEHQCLIRNKCMHTHTGGLRINSWALPTSPFPIKFLLYLSLLPFSHSKSYLKISPTALLGAAIALMRLMVCSAAVSGKVPVSFPLTPKNFGLSAKELSLGHLPTSHSRTTLHRSCKAAGSKDLKESSWETWSTKKFPRRKQERQGRILTSLMLFLREDLMTELLNSCTPAQLRAKWRSIS